MAVPARKSAPLYLRQRRNSANDRPGCRSSKCNHALAAFYSRSRRIDHVFPNFRRGHQPDLFGHRWVRNRHYGRIFRSGRELHCRPRPAPGRFGLEFWPMIALPASGIKEISLWLILFVAFVGGFFSGFLGGGAGYIRMPSMVYVLGIPTHLAVGTDLFEIIISASYGTFSHAVKGNVDILIALVMHTGAAIGAQIGAISTQYFAGPKI